MIECVSCPNDAKVHKHLAHIVYWCVSVFQICGRGKCSNYVQKQLVKEHEKPLVCVFLWILGGYGTAVTSLEGK